jgi:hypothetical protein
MARGLSTISLHTYLYRSDLDPGRVPPLPFPALNTHSPQTQKGNSAISFSQFDAVSNLLSYGVIIRKYHSPLFQVGLTLGFELSCVCSLSIQLRENGMSRGE